MKTTIKIIISPALFLTAFLCATSAWAQVQSVVQTFTVSQDGSGDFKTIQEAVNAVRDHSEIKATIRIKAGVYKEKLVIPSWKKNISLIGENKENTFITNADYSGKDYPGKDFTQNNKYSTYTSYTLLVQADNCVLHNLTIENTAGKIGQAVALMTEADQLLVSNCNILGNQDTLYTAKRGRNYFKNCLITGTTDFIFGEATVLFEQCAIKSLANSYITAASTSKDQPFGFVFLNCKLTADPAATKVFLGRPWRPYAKTVFIETEMDGHILPAGWDPWRGDKMFPEKEKTTFYAEYKSTGPGADPSSRTGWSKQLNKKEVAQYSVKNILKEWIPENIKLN